MEMPMFSLVSSGMSNEQYFFSNCFQSGLLQPQRKVHARLSHIFYRSQICMLLALCFLFLDAGARFMSELSTLKHRGALVLTFNEPH